MIDNAPTTANAQFGTQNPDIVCGTQSKNYFGLCDMISDVWEWTADWYGQKYYAEAPRAIRSAEGKYRVLRGGSWFDQAGTLQFLTRSYRSWAAKRAQRDHRFPLRQEFPHASA